MTTAEYREQMRQLAYDMQDEDRLTIRVNRLFPGVPVSISINKETNKLTISGLSEDQMARLFSGETGT